MGTEVGWAAGSLPRERGAKLPRGERCLVRERSLRASQGTQGPPQEHLLSRRFLAGRGRPSLERASEPAGFWFWGSSPAPPPATSSHLPGYALEPSGTKPALPSLCDASDRISPQPHEATPALTPRYGSGGRGTKGEARASLSAGMAGAKALGTEFAWCVQGGMRQLMWLHGHEGRVAGDRIWGWGQAGSRRRVPQLWWALWPILGGGWGATGRY